MAMTAGYLKETGAVWIHRELLKGKSTLFGRRFLAREYCVSIVGPNAQQVRRYVRNQEEQQKKADAQQELDLS